MLLLDIYSFRDLIFCFVLVPYVFPAVFHFVFTFVLLSVSGLVLLNETLISKQTEFAERRRGGEGGKRVVCVVCPFQLFAI